MKSKVGAGLVALALALASAPATAGYWTEGYRNPWGGNELPRMVSEEREVSAPKRQRQPSTRSDIAWQVAANLMLLGDWGQTRYIARSDRYREANMLLGPEPSTGAVDRYFAAVALLVNGVGYLLPQEWRRPWFIGVTVFEGRCVVRNYGLGVKFDF